MFFHIVLERNMQLHPRHFGRNLRENLVAKLMKDVEGTCSGQHGFVVAITGIENIGKGLIRDGTGFVTFPVKYQCVVFRPFKGEILEAVVTMVNKMGFFAEAGPVQIFVSNHLIPDDMEFQSGDMPNYTTSDGSVKIQKDSEVRLKIIGTRVDATEILIGVPDQAEKDEVVKSVMDLKSAEIEEGYTMDAVASRQVETLKFFIICCRYTRRKELSARLFNFIFKLFLLWAALQGLLMDVRDKLLFEPEYAGNIKEKIPPKSSLRIPSAWLPGALCLLQEVREVKLVQDIGRVAVQHPDAKLYVHDLLLSMALAGSKAYQQRGKWN
ncbi:unnamed protein product [Prunus brigantina]